MRRIKGVAVTLRLFEAVNRAFNGEVVLLLVGPITPNIEHSLNVAGYRLFRRPGEKQAWARKGRHRILCTNIEKDTARFHLAADLAINTSFHDSFNISLSESMVYGIPVVTSSCAGVAEFVYRSNCGLVFDYIEADCPLELCCKGDALIDNEEDFVRKVIRVLTDDHLRHAMGARGSEVAEKQFSRKAVGDSWITLLGDFWNGSTSSP